MRIYARCSGSASARFIMSHFAAGMLVILPCGSLCLDLWKGHAQWRTQRNREIVLLLILLYTFPLIAVFRLLQRSVDINWRRS